jgi:hypothetical protein
MTRGAQANTQEWEVVVEDLQFVYGDIGEDAPAIFGAN